MTLSYAESGYKLPPDNITKIFNTSPFPKIKFIQFEEISLETTYQKYQTLEDISQPADKLAGQDIIKRINAPSKSYPITSMKILNFQTDKEITVELPKDLKIRTYKFSFDNKKIAASYETEQGIELLIIDVEIGKIKQFENIQINDAFEDDGFWWMNDNKTILIKTIPIERGSEPERPLIPESPIIEESYGKTSTERTYQHLLKDEYDELLFDYYFTSQLFLLNSRTNKLTKLGKPRIYEDIVLSPDNKYLFVEKIEQPYSYQVPYYRFPKTFEIINLKGKLIKHIFKRTLQDEVPIGGTYKGPRKFQWQPLKDATLIWVEALDEGNPKNKVSHRDKIMRLVAPFKKEPQEIFRLEHRFSNIEWCEIEDELIFSEYDRDKLWKKKWLYKIGGKSPELIFDLSTRDKYNHPGDIIKRITKRGEKVFIKNGDTVYFKNNKGATPDGNYPYLAEFNLKTKKKKILFKCRENFHETISAFVGDSFDKIAIKSENKLTPPNYFFVDLKTGKREKITDYPNPYLELKDLKIELITYKRKDGIPLSGTLYLPVDYKQGERLPLIIGAYPVEFADSKTASQVDASPNRFISFWFDSVKYLALHGYAVLSGASIPIVGDPETVNETFIEQTITSIEAAINYLNKRGIIDPKRVGIIGHSYGAFMVANILAHSDFCAAGVAKTGAYNRTLTPFGFQKERRTLWQAKEFYTEVSPFMYAEKINEPLLLIHGEEDPNSGTYPIQSRRMYQALKGNEATTRLVILPYEGHIYRARESLLHTLYETIEWFDSFVKYKK
ncbi:MAG: S9 family peptidase [Candidatus Cloacimonetes bacterium]|nr:S9 family peptidase [Candidatus Cloacimonadota bacterium]